MIIDTVEFQCSIYLSPCRSPERFAVERTVLVAGVVIGNGALSLIQLPVSNRANILKEKLRKDDQVLHINEAVT